MVDTFAPELSLVSLTQAENDMAESLGSKSPEQIKVDRVVHYKVATGRKPLGNTTASSMGNKTMTFNSTASNSMTNSTTSPKT